MNIDLVGSRKWFFVSSGALAFLALIVLAIPPALRPGIEFTSGSTALLRFERAVDVAKLRAAYADLGHPEARIQSTGGREYLIRTRELQVPPDSFVTPAPPDEVKPVGPTLAQVLGTATIGAKGGPGKVALRLPFNGNDCEFGATAAEVEAGVRADVVAIISACTGGEIYRVVVGAVVGLIKAADTQDYQPGGSGQPAKDLGERSTIEARLTADFGKFEVREFASVSATVSEAAVRNAAIAVVIASVFILGYVAFAFSSVPRPLRYGVCAIIALGHDVIVTLGIFSFLGKVIGLEIDLMFVTGLLTVIGFSVHDTIVVFDRIRENVQQSPHASLHDNVNAALLQTMARSFNTSITVLMTVAAMLALGGSTIREFLLVILVGIIAGAYSSIGIASQLLVAWEEGDLARLAFWRRGGPGAEQPAA